MDLNPKMLDDIMKKAESIYRKDTKSHKFVAVLIHAQSTLTSCGGAFSVDIAWGSTMAYSLSLDVNCCPWEAGILMPEVSRLEEPVLLLLSMDAFKGKGRGKVCKE
ncbi:hypothetical protein SKAU_G00066130 [Synaphobranchus kaupii]|uniref:Uncharacterized protein n=1 Tax=Synaphobranchus kaupii TaxID=118154 RepID=A0A9Q1G6P3_SYNKA|nr:hypothetical protein SKAU_G00066130 [Synaphobranchus kaupii]